MERMAWGLQTPAGWPWCSPKSSSPAQELLGDVVWLPPAQLDRARRRAGRLPGSCVQMFSSEGRAARA